MRTSQTLRGVGQDEAACCLEGWEHRPRIAWSSCCEMLLFAERVHLYLRLSFCL